MKNHSPIKRHQALVSFSRDHHFGLLLVWKIRQGLRLAVDSEEITAYVLYFFCEDLEHHFREEEELLFIELPGDDNLRQKAEEDHRKVYELVAKMRKDRTNPLLLSEFADLLESHIRFEERELFNHLQEKLGSEKLAEILEEGHKEVRDIDAYWQNKFWEKFK